MKLMAPDDSPWRECPGCRPWGEPTGVAAQGFYLGGAASHAAIQHDGSIDQTRNSYKFFLGYEFPVFLGVEAAWVNFGKFDGVITRRQAAREWVRPENRTAALTGRIPVGDLVTLYAKAGYMYWSTDVTLTGTVTDPHFVAGTDHGTTRSMARVCGFNFGSSRCWVSGNATKLRDVDINAVSAESALRSEAVQRAESRRFAEGDTHMGKLLAVSLVLFSPPLLFFFPPPFPLTTPPLPSSFLLRTNLPSSLRAPFLFHYCSQFTYRASELRQTLRLTDP